MLCSPMVVPSSVYRQCATRVFRHVKSPHLCHQARSFLKVQTRRTQTWTQHGQQVPPVEDIRNIGIIAHVDAGKTTTTERMLYYSGITRCLGNVDHGSTTTDYLPDEQRRKITIQSAAITLHWPPIDSCPPGMTPKTINLIDTPGHQDFRFEVERCIPILDGAVCIIDGVAGVEAHTERVWRCAQEYRIPRIIFVNKLDRDGASFKKSVTDIASRLNVWPLVCQLPLWHQDDFVGVIDVIRRAGVRWASKDKMVNVETSTLQADADLWAEIEKARSSLIEKLCDHDDALLEEFTEHGDALSAVSIRQSIRKVIMDGAGVMAPVFVGASLRNLGVQPLMDAVVDYLPSPSEAHSPEVTLGREKVSLETITSSDKTNSKDKHSRHHQQVGAVAVVFKVVNDPVITTQGQGMLSFVRVYHGSLRKNTQLWNANLGAFERPLAIKQISAAKVAEIPDISAGQIGALTGLKKARTGDTLLMLASHGSSAAAIKQLKVRPPEVSPPVTFISVEPYTMTDAKRLERSLEEMTREDPSLRFHKDEKTDAYIISGMGKLHLEIAVGRLRTYYKFEGYWSTIQVEYKECLDMGITSNRIHYTRDVAGKKGEAACVASIAPIDPRVSNSYGRERDGNIVYFYFNHERGETLPFDADTICDMLYNGALSALARGPRRGSPMHGCAVLLEFDHKRDYFGADTEGQIVQAARLAVKQALDIAHAEGQISVHEPVMLAELSVPEEASGSVQHDISATRGGHILEVRDADTEGQSADNLIDLDKVYIPPDPYEMRQSLREQKKGVTRYMEILAHMPLKEALDYDDVLRGKTGGKSSIAMNFDKFMKVTGHRAKNL